jgi:hypothetical protein
MSGLRIKGWETFQHFKDRRPPWIKLYRDLLDDPEWHCLDAKCAKVLIMLWLVASDDKTGKGLLPDMKRLSFRLRTDEKTLSDCISRLSHWVIRDDIAMISERYRDDAPETETEGEKETDWCVAEKSTKQTADLSPIFGMWSDRLGPLGLAPLEDDLTKTAANKLGVLSRNQKWMDDLPDLLDAIAGSDWHLGKNEIGFIACARWLVKSDKTQDLLSRHRNKTKGRNGSSQQHFVIDPAMNRAMDEEAQRLREISNAKTNSAGTELF